MNRKSLLVIMLVFFTSICFADTLKTLNLSKSFTSSVPSSPRVVRNGFDHVWLVAWRQQAASPKIMARIVESDGTLKTAKVLAKGVTDSAFNFDVFYDSTEYTYLLAYETAKGLQVQLFDGDLKKKGTASLIEGGVSDTDPRLAYDPVGKKFLIFWLSTKDANSHKLLKSRLLDPTGKPLGSEHILADARSKTFESLNISTNQKNGNLVAIVLTKSGDSGTLAGFVIKPDATLLRAKAISFQPSTNGLFTVADASFMDSGTGFGFWADRTSIKYRKLSAKMKFSSAAKSIPNVADASSAQTNMLFDSRNNQFIGAWGASGEVHAVVFSPAGAIAKDPFVVATSSPAAASNIATSYDAQLGNAIVVWDESTGSGNQKFRARAAIFTVGGGQTTKGISVGDNFFSPNTLTISVGDTVTWTVNGNNNHTATSGSGTPTGTFDSGTLSHGQTFSFRFTHSGTFPFFCTIHGAGVMSGTITVNSDGEPNPRY